jgi:hypothetical protein
MTVREGFPAGRGVPMARRQHTSIAVPGLTVRPKHVMNVVLG